MSFPNDPGDASSSDVTADVTANVPTALSFNITVNAQARTLPAASTLADLMALMARTDAIGGAENAPPSSATSATATAVNGEFVPIGRRACRTLREGDQVTCFQLIVGG